MVLCMERIYIPRWRDYFRWRNERAILSEILDCIEKGKMKNIDDVKSYITKKIAELDKNITRLDRLYARFKDQEIKSMFEQMEKESLFE